MGGDEPGQALTELEFDAHELHPEQVQIKVESCGICHSDLSMIDNDWGNARYPLVPGHEVIGTIEKAGDQVKGLAVGDRVGLGWFAGSCLACRPCLSGNHNLCAGAEQTIVGRHGDLPIGCGRIGSGRSNCRTRLIRPVRVRSSAAASRCSRRSRISE